MPRQISRGLSFVLGYSIAFGEAQVPAGGSVDVPASTSAPSMSAVSVPSVAAVGVPAVSSAPDNSSAVPSVPGSVLSTLPTVPSTVPSSSGNVPALTPLSSAPTISTTLENPLGDNSYELGKGEKVITPGATTDMQRVGSSFIGTIIQNDVGQLNRVAVRASSGFEAVLEHFRDPTQADLLSVGIITPPVYDVALQMSGSMLSDQKNKEGSVVLHYEPVVNTTVRLGVLSSLGDKYALVGGRYVGSRLGGFVANVDALATGDNVVSRGFAGMMKNNWYVSAGGNTSGMVSSRQGWLPNYEGMSKDEAHVGILNRVWYGKNGDEGIDVVIGPGLTLEPRGAADLDSRVTEVGNLGVLQSWARFTPNFGGGSVLVEGLLERNTDAGTSTYGGMISKQMESKSGTVQENYFWGLGLVRARNDDCKGWRVVLDEAAPFTYFSERMTAQIDPETYEFDVMVWMASIRMW